MGERAESAATKGMTHDYDKNDEYQRRSSMLTDDDLDALVGATLTDPLRPAPAAPVVIADYGCATGANSVGLLSTLARRVRDLEPQTELTCLHNDLPTNDWSAFFDTLRSSPDTYLDWHNPPIPYVSARSFFEPCASDRSVTVGVSASAAHWLSAQPTYSIADGVYPILADDVRDQVATDAADDWRKFLESRAHDLAPGARLWVHCLATHTDPQGNTHPSGARLFRGMWQVIDTMVSDGLVSRDAADSYVLAAYPRTRTEFLAGIDFNDFELISAEIKHPPSPYTIKYQHDGDKREYADAYTGFVRGFTESSLRAHLLDDALLDEFFARFHARSEADPDIDAYDDLYVMYLLMRRT